MNKQKAVAIWKFLMYSLGDFKNSFFIEDIEWQNI
jgi:hypothetical protein